MPESHRNAVCLFQRGDGAMSCVARSLIVHCAFNFGIWFYQFMSIEREELMFAIRLYNFVCTFLRENGLEDDSH